MISARSEAWLADALRSVVPDKELDRPLAADTSLWDHLVTTGLMDESALVCAAAAYAQVPVADLARADARAVDLLPERWARRFHVVPIAARRGVLEVATSDPQDLDCERTLAFATGCRIAFTLAAPRAITRRIEEVYRTESAVRESAPRIDVQLLGRDHETAPPSADDDPGTATSLVDELLGAGVAGRASDIHIEPDEQGLAVRHRVDGVLQLVRRLPRAVGPALVSRIKIVSGLDIADRLRPQDGRARVAVNGAAVDLRISTLPASHGEKVVIRVLDGGATVLTLDAMGFHDHERQRIETLLACREGLILVTGPTGSGKTTTLYSALRVLAGRGVNIVTVEDPVEYRLEGIVQVQVRERAGLTFASALRSIMRQDPDVILVGEIRDRETAEIAIQASLTGHLVLSTLHTNDAASAVTRLLDIGVPGHKIAAALKGVVAQRLLRRACPSCAGAPGNAGCGDCGGAGYHGRLAIAEVLIADAAFERAVATDATVDRIAAAGRSGGMRSLWESGVEHVARGDTTRAELLRVAAPPATPAVRVDDGQPRRYLTRVPHEESHLVSIAVGTVDVFVIRPLASGWRVLALQRGAETRCPASWETVHGSIEPGEEPEAAAERELLEETGLVADRLYTVAVQPFFMRTVRTVQLAIVFAAFVTEPAEVTVAEEHQSHAWLTVDEAASRFIWPTERNSLRQILELLGTGHAGPVEDVLRIR